MDENAPAGLPQDLPISGGRPSSASFGLLDASMVNVYKQCQAVVFVLNPFSQTSMSYLQKELMQVPRSIPVLVMVSFRDGEVGEGGPHVYRGATEEGIELKPFISIQDIKDFLATPEVRGEAGESRVLHCFECSMKDCYGLKMLYQYFNVPFLLLKSQVIEQQLQQARRDLDEAKVEIQSSIEEESYERYIEAVKAKRARASSATANPQPTTPTSIAATTAAPTMGDQWTVPPSTVPPASLPKAARSKDRRERRLQRKEAAKLKSSPLAPQRAPEVAAESFPNLADLKDFSYTPGREESLDDFFADDTEEAEAAERKKAEEYARIAACLKPELKAKNSLGLNSDDEDDDEPFVYYSLAPVMNTSGSFGTPSMQSKTLTPPPPAEDPPPSLPQRQEATEVPETTPPLEKEQLDGSSLTSPLPTTEYVRHPHSSPERDRKETGARDEDGTLDFVVPGEVNFDDDDDDVKTDDLPVAGKAPLTQGLDIDDMSPLGENILPDDFLKDESDTDLPHVELNYNGGDVKDRGRVGAGGIHKAAPPSQSMPGLSEAAKAVIASTTQSLSEEVQNIKSHHNHRHHHHRSESKGTKEGRHKDRDKRHSKSRKEKRHAAGTADL